MRYSRHGLLMLSGILVAVVFVGIVIPAGVVAKKGGGDTGGGGDPAVLEVMKKINRDLLAKGLGIAVEEVEFFTIGWGRPENRIHQQPYRWVPYDPRRAADGDRISYLVDQSDGSTSSGLTSTQTEAALDGAMAIWGTDKAMKKVELVKRADLGLDYDIFDSFYGYGGYGIWYYADIVHAGWLPRGFFDAVAENPTGGHYILALSVTFIFVDAEGNPTDINGDNYMDTALNEIYYNDNFGDPGGSRPGYPWGIDAGLPGIDVESIALHESGHSLGLGHFGPPPVAVMNPIYGGIQQSPYPADRAGLQTYWASWPNC